MWTRFFLIFLTPDVCVPSRVPFPLSLFVPLRVGARSVLPLVDREAADQGRQFHAPLHDRVRSLAGMFLFFLLLPQKILGFFTITKLVCF